MELSDVERLDAVLAERERWHGCLLCPGEGDGEPYNLLQGPASDEILYHKSKTSLLCYRRGMAACTNTVRTMCV